MYIVILGDVLDGIRIIGTFADYDEALAYAESLPPAGDWHVAELISPEDG